MSSGSRDANPLRKVVNVAIPNGDCCGGIWRPRSQTTGHNGLSATRTRPLTVPHLCAEGRDRVAGGGNAA